jgi:hypothetical protein
MEMVSKFLTKFFRIGRPSRDEEDVKGGIESSTPRVGAAQEPTVSQLFEEFKIHLAAELSESVYRDKIEGYIRRTRDSSTRSATREALQQVAGSVAACICDNFDQKITHELAAVKQAPWRARLPDHPLQTAEEIEEFLSEFTRTHLSRFYEPNDDTVRSIATQVAHDDFRRVHVPDELIPGLAQLALYDFVIFCGKLVMRPSTLTYMTRSDRSA